MGGSVLPINTEIPAHQRAQRMGGGAGTPTPLIAPCLSSFSLLFLL
jgi:hypothetical protein